MKKLVILALALAVCILSYIAGHFTSYSSGFYAGVNHAIEDSVIFTIELYNPASPEDNLRDDGTDQTIFIILDGEIYEHGMLQG